MKARYLVAASLAVMLLSGCASEEKPVAPSDGTTSLVESTVESGGSSHIEITPSSNGGVSSVESTGIGDSEVSSEGTSLAQSSQTTISEAPEADWRAFGSEVNIRDEAFDSRWSFGDAKAHGWEYESSTAIVKPNELGSSQILMTKGDKSVYVTVFNATATDKVATECEIVGVVCSNEGAEIGNDDAFIDFTVGSDLKHAYAVMGPVTKINSYRGYESFTVPTDEGTLYYFTYDDSSKLTSVGIIHNASNGQPLLVANPEEPVVSESALGTIIHINEEIFDTMWSFEEAKSHGWVYEPSKDVVRPNEVGMFQVPLTKGDKSVYAKVFNATESDRVSTECEIIGAVCPYEGASIGDEDSKVQFRVGMDLDTANSMMNQVSSVQSYRGYESFTVSTDEGTLYYFVYNEYSKLASVGITHKASNGQTFIETE